MKNALAPLVIGCLLLCRIDAQELEPRQYTNVPIGFNFLVAGYADSEGGVVVDPSIELDDAAIEVDGVLLGYARAFGLGRLSSKVDAGIARMCLSGSATFGGQPVSRNVCGLTDAKMRWSVNFAGAPALRQEEFATYRQRLIVGASLQVSAPVGEYESDKLINIGTNRWSAKLEVGASKALQPWTFEISLAGTFYQENDEFFATRTRQQEPIYALQGHVVRNFPSRVWLAVNATHYRGGRTSVDGLPNTDLQSNGRLGVTVSVPLSRRQSLKANVSSGVSTRTGSDFDTLGLAWQYAWGAR